MSVQKSFDGIMKYLFTFQILNKMYHLTTKSYPRHKASDEFDDNIQKHIDKFAEVYIGKYNVNLNIPNLELNSEYLSDVGIYKLFIESREFLENLEIYVIDTELLNIRDELLGDINKTIYLFRLK